MAALGQDAIDRLEPPEAFSQLNGMKASRWGAELTEYVSAMQMPKTMSSKFGSRFTYTVTAAANKVGMAYIRPFYSHTHGRDTSPLMGEQFLFASTWWCQYCLARPTGTQVLR